MMSPEIEKLIEFREILYGCFPKRADAIMNLLDAICCEGRNCDSVIQLSKAVPFERQYSSITDAISEGLPSTLWSKIQKLIYRYYADNSAGGAHRFILDCTGNPRPHAKTLEDRHMTHTPNPAPGNKPVAVGHQYSMLTSLPKDPADNNRHWLLPLSTVRVPSNKKGNEVGMIQLTDTIEQLALTKQLSISIGDSLYGSEFCRKQAVKTKNLIHLFRVNSTRNFFHIPLPATKPVKAGRQKVFGAKMNLKDVSTHTPSEKQLTTQWLTRSGKTNTIKIEGWNNMLLRGSRDFRSQEHPINLIRIEVIKDSGEPLYKRPMWLAVIGERRNELSLLDAYESYKSRYDIEHLFRFGKRNLLIDSYQTADVAHEELWWSLCSLAYTQLYASRKITACLPEPWERYLSEYKNTETSQNLVSSPSQTQRGFADMLKRIGTPAKPCVPRGNPSGRKVGETQLKREVHDVIFKKKKPIKKVNDGVVLGSGNKGNCSDRQKMQALANWMQFALQEMSVMVSKLSKTPIESG